MADIKLQVYRGNAGPEKIDFRESKGEFLGSPEDEHRTILEYRANINPDTAEGMQVLDRVNGLLADMADDQPEAVQKIADIFGLEGSGPVKLAFRVYDND